MFHNATELICCFRFEEEMLRPVPKCFLTSTKGGGKVTCKECITILPAIAQMFVSSVCIPLALQLSTLRAILLRPSVRAIMTVKAVSGGWEQDRI